MRYVPMNLAEPGMALGQELYDGDGQLLVARHLILDKDYIKALGDLGFPGVYIDDEFTEGIRIQEVVSPEVRREAIRGVRELFISNAYDEDAAEEEARIKKLVLDVIEDILSNGDVMYNMLDLKVYDDYTYFHSVNVAVLSVMMGSQMCMTCLLYPSGAADELSPVVPVWRRLPDSLNVETMTHRGGIVYASLVADI